MRKEVYDHDDKGNDEGVMIPSFSEFVGPSIRND